VDIRSPDGLGVAKLGGLLGSGRNTKVERVQAWRLSAVVPVTALGEFRVGYGQRKNQDLAANPEKTGYDLGIKPNF